MFSGETGLCNVEIPEDPQVLPGGVYPYHSITPQNEDCQLVGLVHIYLPWGEDSRLAIALVHAQSGQS